MLKRSLRHWFFLVLVLLLLPSLNTPPISLAIETYREQPFAPLPGWVHDSLGVGYDESPEKHGIRLVGENAGLPVIADIDGGAANSKEIVFGGKDGYFTAKYIPWPMFRNKAQLTGQFEVVVTPTPTPKPGTTQTPAATVVTNKTNTASTGVCYTKLPNITYVAKSGGDFTTITASLNSITDASTTNPYLIRVAPGVYTEQVKMKPYVSIEGAGEGITIIKYTGSTNSPGTDSSSATVIGANYAELRYLTVQSISNNTKDTYVNAIYNKGTSPTLSHLTITALGGSSSCGVFNEQSSPTMSNLSITASGASNSCGVYNGGSSPMMSNLSITASGSMYSQGVDNAQSLPTMSNLSITSITLLSLSDATSEGVNNYTSLPTMSNLSITTSGGMYSTGVHNTQLSSPTMSNLSITTSGGMYSTGVGNDYYSSPTMSNLSIAVSGPSNSYKSCGISNNTESSPVMSNLSIAVSGGNTSYGVRNNVKSSPTVYSSRIKGANNSVYNDSSTTKIADTMLDGAVYNGNGSSSTCIGSFNSNFVVLNGSCQ